MEGFILVALAIVYLLVAADTAEKIDELTGHEGSGFVFVSTFTIFTLLTFYLRNK